MFNFSFGSLENTVWLLCVAVAVIFFIGFSFLAIRLWRQFWGKMPPVVCVCRVNGRIGYVLRKEKEKSDVRYWKAVWRGMKDFTAINPVTGGRRLCPDLAYSPVFFFYEEEEWHCIALLKKYCYLQEAVFVVPEARVPCEFQICWKHFFGREWNEKDWPTPNKVSS